MSVPVTHPRRSLALLAATALVVAGCAVDPSLNPAGRAEDDKAPSIDHEKVDADVDVRADFEKAMRYLRDGDYEQGAKLLVGVTERAPDRVVPYINLAIAYRRMGRLPAAEESIRKALAVAPEDPLANTEYGLICRKTGKFGEARKAYERALEQNPEFLPARKNLGILCDMYLRDAECALDHYRRYSTAVPEDKTVQVWIADLEKRLGKAGH